jgi:hypothetical protein
MEPQMNLKSKKEKVKKISTLLSLLVLVLLSNIKGQTYSISSNTTWSSAPACTSGCTFNISAGVTLTINTAFTCSTCTFNNGTVDINKTLTCQPCTFNGNAINISNAQLFSNSGTTSITNATVNVTGTSSTVQGSIGTNTAFTISSSIITFNNYSYFNNNGSGLTVSGITGSPSTLTFTGNSYFTSNSSVYIQSNSQFVIGDGSSGSSAYFNFAGTTLAIYGNSSISIKNSSNYYFNWGSYQYYATNTSPTSTSYPNTSAPKLFGCALLNNAGITTCTVLPVSLSDFNALANNGNSVDLSWTIAQETSFDHFSIQRSPDGTKWETIGVVQSSGYNSSSTGYQFTDPSPLNGNNDYRLQLVDLDGTFTYSKIISLQLEGSAENKVSIFPNPITNLTFTLKVPSAGTTIVKVYAMDGRFLYTTTFSGQNQYQVKLPSSANGNSMLAIQVISNGTTQAFNALNR